MKDGVRQVCYITGTRADFGLMASTLRLIEADPRLALGVLVTGMHLSERFGLTVREIEAEGLRIIGRVDCDMRDSTGAQMARNIGRMIGGFVDALEADRPELVLVLGDRGEMLAGALAAIHLGIPVVHLHGGERSGTVDEPVRHAISKLAHLHLVATDDARERLVRMGETPAAITVVGAPGLDGLADLPRAQRAELCRGVELEAGDRLALLVYHPVLHEAAEAGAQFEAIADALADAGFQVLALMPNSDGGGDAVRSALLARRASRFVVRTHLPRAEFVAWMACADVMIGNSSSGIIEAATFGTPVINLGSRQHMRERNDNVLDLPVDRAAIAAALARLAHAPRPPIANRYGDGRAGARIVELLASTPLPASLLAKCNAY